MYKDPVGHRIKQLNNLIRKRFEYQFGKADHTTMMQRLVIGLVHTRLNEGKETFQKDIETELCISRSTTSEMLKLMCQKNMIERVSVAHDARLKKIVLTKEYEEHVNHINEEIINIHNELVEGLTDEEIQCFIEISDKMISNMNKERKG